MSDKLQGGIKAGSTSLSLPIILRKTADNTEQTGKVAVDMTASYWRQGGLRVGITLSNLAAVDSVYSSGGVKEVDATNMPGLYRLDPPDAAIATGVDWVVIAIKVASTYVFYERYALTTNVVATGDSFVRIGAPAGASVSADIVAVKAETASIQTDTNDLQTQVGTAGAGLTNLGGMSTTMKAQVQTEAEDALVTHRLDELVNADSDIDGVAPPTVGSVFHELMSKTAGSFTFDQTTDSLEAVRDKETDIETDTQDIQTRLPAALVGGRMDSNVQAMADAIITAAKFAAGAIDANAIATDAFGSLELDAAAANEIRDAVWAKIVESQGSYTAQQILSVVLSILAGVTTTNGSVLKTPDGVSTRVTATLNASDERTAMTITPSA